MTHAIDKSRAVRRFAVGAEPSPQGTHFRVWAPKWKELQVVILRGGETRRASLDREPGGYFSGLVPEARRRSALYLRSIPRTEPSS